MTILHLFLWSLAGAFLAFSMVTYGIFTYFCLKQPPPPRLWAACHGRRLACLAWGLVTSLGGQVLVCLSYPFGRLFERLTCRDRRGQGPVVLCLHGLYHNPTAFWGLRPALLRVGLPRVLCLGYNSLGATFEERAGELARRVRALVPGETPLCFVGHSLGGLLARRLAAEPDLAGRTCALVTLGAPHGGSVLAALAVGRLGRSLAPHGPVAVAVAALPDPPGAALLSLASPVDNLVVPLGGLALGRRAWREEATPPASHIAMLYHPAVLRRVAAFLGQAIAARVAGAPS
ncbi:MAG: esterase/lipase family protein [Solidesulfovibrio sp. DCME]|uniref:esterase/lipase family protein n=1 Tax=Solidesulfovibrio sp. DCME TaxID=3447380 RepID=UPI003D0960B0